MIEAAEAEGRIEPGRTTIVEATCGNTGIALAFVCAAKGYDLVLTLPQGMSREREGLLRLYGAEVVRIESMGGMNEAVEAARRMAASAATASCPTSSPTRPTRRSTGARPAEEIWRDTDGRVDVFVAGVGTGGTITGCGELLKERNPDLHVVARRAGDLAGAVRRAARPAQDPGHRRRASCPRCSTATCSTRSSPSTTRTRSRPPACCARREGVLAGISGGAARVGGARGRPRPEIAGKRIVAILPDSGERYVSTPFFAP